MQHLFHTLSGVFKEFEGGATVDEAVVFAVWRRIAGKELAIHAVPAQFEKRRLIISVSSETWIKHLKDLRGQMLSRINGILGDGSVGFIEFRIDENAAVFKRSNDLETESSESEIENAVLGEITPELRASADAIKDKNLRKQFLLAAGSSLMHQRRKL